MNATPRAAQACHALGVLACRRGNLHEGAELFRKAVELDADFVLGWMDLGAALRELADPAGATACFDRVLAIDPNCAEAHNSRGEALSAQRRHQDALASYEAAIRLSEGDARAYSNAGAALLELGSCHAAIERFDRALSIRPSYVRAISNRGSALHYLGRFTEAIAEFDQALTIQPDCAEARFNRGLVRLLLGQFKSGLSDYEARLKAVNAPARDFVQPRWRADSDIKGKTILVHAEQGLGDTLQFCRYVPLLAGRGARVVLEAQPELVSVLRALDGAARIVACGDPLPVFDVHCPLLSLPLACGTDLSNIPSGAACLRADGQRVLRWQARLGPKGRAPRIGLAWSGGRLLKNDRNRNIPLRDLVGTLGDIEAEFISLQKDVRQSDQAALAGSDAVRHFGNDLEDFADTAALVSLLDLVVTVDTSVAHLAAAIGKPTWILLPWVPDWRWLLEREDSPWYPTVRLWRQRTPGDWPAVLAAVRAELAERSRTVSFDNRSISTPNFPP